MNSLQCTSCHCECKLLRSNYSLDYNPNMYSNVYQWTQENGSIAQVFPAVTYILQMAHFQIQYWMKKFSDQKGFPHSYHWSFEQFQQGNRFQGWLENHCLSEAVDNALFFCQTVTLNKNCQKRENMILYNFLNILSHFIRCNCD